MLVDIDKSMRHITENCSVSINLRVECIIVPRNFLSVRNSVKTELARCTEISDGY